MFCFSLQLLPEIFLIITRTQRDTIINVYRNTSSCKVLVILVRFESKLNFLDGTVSKNHHISDFTKIRPVAAELFHADTDRQTYIYRRKYMTKLAVAFHNFANAPKKRLAHNPTSLERPFLKLLTFQ